MPLVGPLVRPIAQKSMGLAANHLILLAFAGMTLFLDKPLVQVGQDAGQAAAPQKKSSFSKVLCGRLQRL